jgi:hypothetical protein
MKSPRLLVFAISLLVFPTVALAASSWPAGSGTEINSSSVSEPSGAVVLDDTLWIVDDGGYLWSMELDGSSKTSYYLGGDLEGITTEGGYLYIGIENPDGVMEVDPSTGTATGESWDLTTYMTGSDNMGLEALTYAEGYFYAGLQEDGHVFVFELNVGGSVSFIAELDSPVGYTDIAGLHYMDGVFYAVYDGYNRISLMEVDDLTAPTTFIVLTDDYGTDLRYELEGDTQEGVAFDGTTIYLAEDAGEIYYYEGFPTVINAEEEEEEVTEPDYSYVDSYSIDYTNEIITVTYQSGDTIDIDFRAEIAVNVRISADNVAIIIRNGRLIRGYIDGVETWRRMLPPRGH